MDVSKERREFEKQIQIKDYPYGITAEATSFCNLKCKICANSVMKRPKGYMEESLYKKIVDEVAEVFPESFFWINGYGEPLLHKGLFDMIKYAVDCGLKKISMNTNAMLLTEEKADQLLDSGIQHIVISIDGFKAETYESIRVGAVRDVVYKNASYLLKRVREMQGNRPTVELQMIEMPETLPEEEEWIAFWQDKGADIKLKTYTTWGESVGKAGNIPTERLACGDCNLLDIRWDGVIPYCMTGDVEGEDILGNAYTDSLQDVWKKKRETFCQYHITHQFDKLPPHCQKCPDWLAMPAKRMTERNKANE